ncbi:MAG: response regulator [Burkholderiaceae bacterium]
MTDARNPQPKVILIAEDEPKIASLLVDYLHQGGYETIWCDQGPDALQATKTEQIDLILLDLMLPGMDGLTICREVRRVSEIPIIMITAKVEEVDRLLGLELGADDYLCKPFSPREVVARVKAVLRRVASTRANGAVRTIDQLTIDRERMVATFCGQRLQLTPSEFEILAALAALPGVIFSRNQLLDRLREGQFDISDRAIDSHIKNLRRKCAGANPDRLLIHSVYGAGYKLEDVEND